MLISQVSSSYCQLSVFFNRLAQYKRHFGKLSESRIAIPPLATQQAIVAEIDAELALVDANRDLAERFEKKIQAALDRVWDENEPAPAEE